MKIVVLQENIVKALTLAGKFLPSKTTTLPSMSSFLISSKKGQITITATDLDSSIRVDIPGKEEEEGEVLIPAKTATLLVGALQSGKVKIFTEKGKVVIQGVKSRVVLNTEKVQEYPRPSTKDEESSIKIKSSLITSTYKMVSFASSTDQSRAVLTGVLFDVKEDGLNIVATDGFRLALFSRKNKGEGLVKSLLIPVKVLQALSGVVGGGKDDEVGLLIEKDGSQIVFLLPGVRISTRVIEGSFPEYERIIPSEHKTRATIDTEELLRAVRFASVLARESSNIIRIKLDGEKITVSANAPQTGENTTSAGAVVEGEPVETAFNFRFLIDFLSLGIGKEVMFETVGPLSPCMFRYRNEPQYTYIVMPVRLQDAQ